MMSDARNVIRFVEALVVAPASTTPRRIQGSDLDMATTGLRALQT
jgi:hypothetical protein